jgi:hypothetical protein
MLFFSLDWLWHRLQVVLYFFGFSLSVMIFELNLIAVKVLGREEAIVDMDAVV